MVVSCALIYQRYNASVTYSNVTLGMYLFRKKQMMNIKQPAWRPNEGCRAKLAV
jgi:hypothetical protein